MMLSYLPPSLQCSKYKTGLHLFICRIHASTLHSSGPQEESEVQDLGTVTTSTKFCLLDSLWRGFSNWGSGPLSLNPKLHFTSSIYNGVKYIKKCF
uniref:Uncharacterized protein n=1 Tax=Gopherus agassizii TaxID=38772 RepID=A0A452J4X1_9SAUR